MNSSVADLIEDVIAIEGGYSNDPADSGGETNFGITIRQARKFGYQGEMVDMPRSVAETIYAQNYWYEPGFYDVSTSSMLVARELFDTGINCGVGKAAEFFQMALNAFNREGTDYADIKEDGDIGPATLKAFALYLKTRGNSGVVVMLKALNSLQGAHYIELSRRRQKDERFTFGWFYNRVGMPT